jgi:hypothetical protein
MAFFFETNLNASFSISDDDVDVDVDVVARLELSLHLVLLSILYIYIYICRAYSNCFKQMQRERQDIVDELFRNKRINYPRRSIVLKGLNDLQQIDLAFFPDFIQENDGFGIILFIIDCFSRRLWTIPLKDKKGETVAKAMDTFYRENESFIPKLLQSDKGTEFYNVHFKTITDRLQIKHYSTDSDKKAAFVERSIRTIRTWLNKEFLLKGHHKWTDLLEGTVKRYNQKIHSSTGFRPIDVNMYNQLEVLDTLKRRWAKTQDKLKRPKNCFKIGDHVRLSRLKSTFEKGSTYNWSPAIYKIFQVNDSAKPYTYLIENAHNNFKIPGQVYHHELTRVKHSDVYLVEKKLRRHPTRTNRYFVKWLGFNTSENSWITLDEGNL